MSSELTEDDRERIESFCETPPYARSPEDLTPGRDDDPDQQEADESMFATVWNLVRRR